MSTEDRRVGQVRTICQTAMGCARVVAKNDPGDDTFAYERQTYQRRKLRALQVTNLIRDRQQIEAALHCIIDLCMTAGEAKDAARLLSRISSPTICETIMRSHPVLARMGPII
jgi:hypothetical protein